MSKSEQHADTNNLVGIGAMAGGNVVLIVNDTLVKLAAEALPMSQVIALRASLATILLLMFARLMSGPFPPLTARLFVRSLLEAGTSFSYLYALQLIPIGDLAGLQQIIPLAIMAGAALVFGERIGWKGWIAAFVGLCGAMLIIRPGGASQAGGISGLGVLLAGVAVAFQVARDLLTRALPAQWPPAFVAGTGQIAMLAGGLCLSFVEPWQWPPMQVASKIGVAAVFLSLGMAMLVVAMQAGRIAVVSPFRYVGLIAALASGYLVWGQFPDTLSLVGSAIIVASGLFSLWQSRRRPRSAATASNGSHMPGKARTDAL